MMIREAMVLIAVALQCHGFLLNPLHVGVCWSRSAPEKRIRTLCMAYDVRYSPNTWQGQPLEPGFGGIWPGDPDAETRKVTFVNKEGEIMASTDVPVDRYVFFAAEDAGVDVPIVNKRRMCRNGCCTTCAAKVLDGKVKQEGSLGLLKELKREGWALMCCSYAKTDLTVELQEEDEVYIRQFGDDFEGGGVEWGGFLPEDD